MGLRLSSWSPRVLSPQARPPSSTGVFDVHDGSGVPGLRGPEAILLRCTPSFPILADRHCCPIVDDREYRTHRGGSTRYSFGRVDGPLPVLSVKLTLQKTTQQLLVCVYMHTELFTTRCYHRVVTSQTAPLMAPRLQTPINTLSLALPRGPPSGMYVST